MNARSRFRTCLVLLLSMAMLAAIAPQAFALIMGGEGNSPIRDPGWPKGAEVIFNTKWRIAYWEGPPFGGGQWHAECRGDAKALSAVLADFAKLDVKNKHVVLHDGVGNSFWLNINNEPAKRDKAKMDWSFMVWQPANWQRLRKMPADLKPPDVADAKDGPPAQIDVYAGGNIKWADVVVPKEIKIVDQRLEAHGHNLTDGIVLEGTVTDLETKKPVAAKVRLQRIMPQKKGGYSYPDAAEVATEKDGRWLLKKVPVGSHRVVIEADGYVSRIVAYVNFEQPQWHAYDSGLARAAVVTGRVVDEAGKPLADVDVRFADVTPNAGGSYGSPAGYTFKTDADGRFRAEQLPVGKATVWVYKPGFVRPGIGEKITTPKENVELKMIKSARIIVTVDFTDKARPPGYMVTMTPEGGDKIGTYGGSGNINAKNQMTFENVPPGKYTVHGRPNPGSDKEETEPVAIDPKGGQTIEVRLPAK